MASDSRPAFALGSNIGKRRCAFGRSVTARLLGFAEHEPPILVVSGSLNRHRTRQNISPWPKF
ncbi:MAG: hypothetical protein C5B50_17540 [Verrucomicrobia bacterium]|nr:MAG: hypothetical protein C5B50_17540 [Verrucomicrobiota bacterium]